MTEISIDNRVKALRDMHSETLGLNQKQISIRDYLARQAQTIVDEHSQGNGAVCFHLSCWYPDLVGASRDNIMAAAVTADIAQHTIAREHGFVDWAAVQGLGDSRFDVDFEQAVDHLLSGRIAELQQSLERNPALIDQRSQYAHGATLLHYLGANGVESHRQFTPLNALEMATCLLCAGANVNVSANIYGGSTVLGLWLSSAHPAKAGVLDEVASLLRDAGAK